jgi:hypothetical protein
MSEITYIIERSGLLYSAAELFALLSCDEQLVTAKKRNNNLINV